MSEPAILFEGTEEFHRNPAAFYRALRQRYGALAPVYLAPDVPATLVLNWRTARRILHDPEHFPADPRTWQRTIAEDSPLLAMMGWHRSARDTDGVEHLRYRQPSVAAIDDVDLFAMHDRVEDFATRLIDDFLPAGKADLVSQYAFPLYYAVLSKVFGCPHDIGQRVAAAMADRFNSGGAAPGAMDTLDQALTELVEFRRAYPGQDITTRLIQHRVGLDDEEVVAQLLSMCGAGLQAGPNLVCNALLLALTDERYGSSLIGGGLHTRDAVDRALFNAPPMTNFCITYPRQPILVEDTWLPAHQPVIISIAACNNDPAIAGGDDPGNRAHFAFGAGPHQCPARTLAYQVTVDAIDYLFDLIPDITLAIPTDQLQWRPGMHHRALTALPTTFPPAERSGPPSDHSSPPPDAFPFPFYSQGDHNATRTTQRHRLGNGAYPGPASGSAPARR
ncbi:cytochrome P450 [Nocardia vaccinii]|uniref:cytochrome P450 n=1 Tax=Nocardia vaccinii TaxID=1822 RepID=UPI00082FD75D|nr:cytochrome P450 [Nocardia vaccinii]